ncbi:TPA: two-component system QseEF-associated lipoprotein QseG [Salmonella bongori]|uniref:Putative alpha helix protein n=1 Tax=Salmonella bongori N268-08 TaxID=1197719 RepID=S5NB47_SALBN|nr:two-component system QseEF-associated lipoprotein QseG [Salmonella bongori]AGR59860.1 putative alpha helix protein [Salmonella bongori N268-08]ECE6546705.1 two-component system QseEF-associated lipoprotein QseG [Salmonella bongori]ECI3517886.1 two-component system QseEF-associated lipoprotein QseG [Salmonella bongori]EDP8575344.1 two-component system QseEF-associated lipoprotein QseG [Salmonella bongori]EDP8591538.1 two-component system QseEF-associated lipoprotein QseG [Salmonella bongori]
MNLSLVSMPHVLFLIVKRFLSRWGIPASISCLALTACVPHAAQQRPGGPAQDKLPHYQLADYLPTACADIWSLRGQAVETNPLYWLRAIDCADRLMPVQSRAEARALADDGWQNAFRRGILLADAKITPPERRAMVTRLEALSAQIPAQVRPVYQIWHDGQTLQLALSAERQRYSKLQQTSDSELDALRQQQQALQTQLDLTTRKLENLTDIERQLSTRKPAGNYNADTPHTDDKPAISGDGAAPSPSQDEVTP